MADKSGGHGEIGSPSLGGDSGVVSVPAASPPAYTSPKSFLVRAIEAIRFRKRAKLDKIIKLAMEKGSITNDDVEKLVRVSHATATRYLAQLVAEGRLEQFGSRGGARYILANNSNGGN